MFPDPPQPPCPVPIIGVIVGLVLVAEAVVTGVVIWWKKHSGVEMKDKILTWILLVIRA